MIGIIGAMDVEVSTLIERLEHPSVRVVSGLRFHEGELCGRDEVIVRGGVGKVNAAMCAETMILCGHPVLIVNVGVAGALADRYSIGDISVARGLVQFDVDSTALGEPIGMVSTVNRVDFPCAPRAVEGLCRAARSAGMQVRVTRIASGDKFNDSAAEKAADPVPLRGGGVRHGRMSHRPGLLYQRRGLRRAARHFGCHRRRSQRGIQLLQGSAADRATRTLLAFLESPASAGL